MEAPITRGGGSSCDEERRGGRERRDGGQEEDGLAWSCTRGARRGHLDDPKCSRFVQQMQVGCESIL